MATRALADAPADAGFDAESGEAQLAAPQTVANAELMSALANRDMEERRRAIEHAVAVADPDALLALVADHSDAGGRNAAMEVLEKAGARSVPALVKALKSADEEVVMFAATVLGKTRASAAVPPLLKLLKHSDMNVVVAAVDSLGQLRAKAAALPLAALLDGDPWLRFAAANALGEIGDDSAVENLVSLLGDAMLRDIVLVALGRIGSPRALPALCKLLLESTERSVFEPSLCAVAHIIERQTDEAALLSIPEWAALQSSGAAAFRQRLSTALSDGEPGNAERLEVKRAAALVVLGLRIEALYLDLVRAANDGELLEVLRFCVLGIGQRIGSALLAGLLSPDAPVRAFACTCIGALNVPSAVGPVMVAIDDTDQQVRAAAIETLAHIRAIEAVPCIVKALRDPAEAVREVARKALARMDAVAVSSALLHPPPTSMEGVMAALEIFALNPHPGCQAFLGACMGHPVPQVRCAAARALARQPGFEHSGIPERLLADQSVEVRRETLRALSAPRRLALQSKLLAFVEQDAALRADAIQCLATLGDPMIAARITQILMANASSCDGPVAEAIVLLNHPVCEPVLVHLLGAADPEVRRIAVTGIGRLGSRPALARAAAAGQDAAPEVRLAAVDVLARARDTESLERLVMDEDARVAKAARRQLEDLASVS